MDEPEVIILSDDDDDDICDTTCDDVSVLIVEVEDVKKIDDPLPPSALEEDLVVTFSRGPEVLPHARYDCPVHPFTPTDSEVTAPVADNRLLCDQCFCYICDKLASLCELWCHSGACHCNSHKRSKFWSSQRDLGLLGSLRAFKLTLNDIDTHLRQADVMLQKFNKELCLMYTRFLNGKPEEETLIYDYSEIFTYISCFLNEADKRDSRAAAVMNLGAVKDFINHCQVSGTNAQSLTANILKAKMVLLQRAVETLQRLMVTADFTSDFIFKLQDFYKNLSFPSEMKHMKNSLCVRPWDDVLLVSVMKGQNVTGYRKDKGKKDVLTEQSPVVLMRAEALQKQHRYRELKRYLEVVQTNNHKILRQLQDLIPFFMCLDGDLSAAQYRLAGSASCLTPRLFRFYFSIFKTATAPTMSVSHTDQLCYSMKGWEPITGTKPLKLIDLVKFTLKVQKFCHAVYADPQCWVSILEVVNQPSGPDVALPPPCPQFLLQAKEVVNSILVNMGTHVYIPPNFLGPYPYQALLLMVTGALSYRIHAGKLTAAMPVLNTFQGNGWALEWLWENMTMERLISFSKEVAEETSADEKKFSPIPGAILPPQPCSAGSWDHTYCNPPADDRYPAQDNVRFSRYT